MAILDVSGLEEDIKSMEQSLMPDENKCYECDRYFPNKLALSSHTDSHLRPKASTTASQHMSASQHMCYQCDQSFDTEQKLNDHVQVHTRALRPASKTNFCHLCHNQIESSIFTQHLRSEHSSSNQPVKRQNKCSRCDTTFNNLLEFHKHTEIKHPHACDKCKLSFISSLNLAQHRETRHKGMDTSAYNCDDCGLVVSNREVYDDHRDNYIKS